MSILAVNAGAAYQIESLEGPRYRRYFDRLVRPEELGDITWTNTARCSCPAARRLTASCRMPTLRAYLDVAARSSRWANAIASNGCRAFASRPSKRISGGGWNPAAISA